MVAPKHIIVTDDDPAIQDAIRMMLERKGYAVTAFRTGEPLLKETFEIPRLFILDKQLPGIDGLDLCRHLKAQEATRHIPILILSASPQIEAQAKEACADAFLTKPFKMQELRALVEQLAG